MEHNIAAMSEKQTAGIGKGTPGPGRKKGVPNKNTQQLREMILHALDGAGGQKYLEGVAQSHPQAFVSLLGKVLPTTLDGSIGLTVNWPVGVPPIESR